MSPELSSEFEARGDEIDDDNLVKVEVGSGEQGCESHCPESEDDE